MTSRPVRPIGDGDKGGNGMRILGEKTRKSFLGRENGSRHVYRERGGRRDRGHFFILIFGLPVRRTTPAEAGQ